ncbi:MAG: sulfatase-like hydrolase/transferase [Lentisphaerae bacterium]|nr:sulfatase-like hydrolase/transferase [Lentisphaerota bacterium]
MPQRPNIVLFVPDSYRGDVLGHQGNPVARTPNLDALVATEAVSYGNAFAQNPVCTPSRCSFMTGWYPHVHGHRSMRNMLKEHEPNLLSVLRSSGYDVWWAGRNDLVRVRQASDYRRYCDVKVAPAKSHAFQQYKFPAALAAADPRRSVEYGGVLSRAGVGAPYFDGDAACVHGAIELIRSHAGAKPFCCYVALRDPHPPYYALEDYYQAINPARLPPRIPVPGAAARLPAALDALRAEYGSATLSEEQWQDLRRIYYAMCARVDALFGEVVAALRERGLYDHTWIFFFSDHGDFAGDYSLPEKTHLTLQDCLLRSPLIVKPPADVPLKPGNRRQLVELLDITATLYDFLGIDPGYACQGVSLRASLAGAPGALHEAVFAEVGARKNEGEFFNAEVANMPPDNFYSHQRRATLLHHKAGSYAVMCRTLKHKYIRRCYTGHHELFDLAADPGETRNLSGRRRYAKIERRMETLLLDYLLRTGDVLPREQDSRQL